MTARPPERGGRGRAGTDLSPPPRRFALQQELEDTPAEALRTVRYSYRIAVAQNDQELLVYHRHSYDDLHTPLGAMPEQALPTGEVDAA